MQNPEVFLKKLHGKNEEKTRFRAENLSSLRP